MPAPFPGMDPFIERQAWEDFHHAFIEAMREALTSSLRPRYIVKVELRVYVEHVPDPQLGIIRPDLSVLEPNSPTYRSAGTAPAVAAAAASVILTLPVPERIQEAFLTIRERETMEVVTVIEVLSPGNKRPGSDGRREYLNKRETVLRSATHLIELDLLRGGERLPTIEALPRADFYAFVCRAQQRPRAEVYPWTLRHPLPSIPIPLAQGDPEIGLDLQAVFTTVYERAGYDYALDYGAPVEPPLSEDEQAWCADMLQQAAPPSQTSA